MNTLKYIVTRYAETQREYLTNSFEIKDHILENCLFERIGDAMKVAAKVNDTIAECGCGQRYKVISIENKDFDGIILS